MGGCGRVVGEQRRQRLRVTAPLISDESYGIGVVFHFNGIEEAAKVPGNDEGHITHQSNTPYSGPTANAYSN